MRYLLSCTLAVSFLVGCGMESSPPVVAGEDRAPATMAATAPAGDQPATQPAGGPVMAYVYGQPITMDRLCDFLVEAYGMPVAQQLIATELVRREAATMGIPAPTPQEVQEESDGVLRELFPQVTSQAQREQLLAKMLKERGMLPRQWQMVMHRNVYLRKMAQRTVTVSEQEIADEYGLEYGRQVQVRHIEAPTIQAAQDVLRRLEAGEDFTKLATELSTATTSQEGGLLPPIGPKSRIPPAIREAALAMTEVGQLSQPIQSGTVFHILKLEKVIEPQSVPLERVSEQIRRRLMDQKIRGEQRRIIESLIEQAQEDKQIQFVNPTLDAQSKRPPED